MNKSLFPEWVDKWFKAIAKRIVEKINGSKDAPVYIHKKDLRPEYTPDLKWGTLTVNGTAVAADVVSMDSQLPLKKRDSIQKAQGDIPKSGMKIALNEKTMSQIGIIRRQKGMDNVIVQKLFADAKKCITGVYELHEFMYLQALSTGVTSIANENNTGTAVRIDFQHPDRNKFGASIPWSNPNAKPLDDIKRIIKVAKAKGDTISVIRMDDDTFDVFSSNTQVKEAYAFSQNFVGTNIATPDLEQVNAFMSRRHKVTIEVIDRTVVFEKNGVKTTLKPWANNAVVFLTTTQLGTITYGTLAEEDFPVASVAYQKVDDYILVSKYSKNDPVREFTSSQAIAIPVLDDVDSIYILDCEEADTDTQVEGDAVFTYQENDYTKASVLAGIKAAKPTSKLTIDSTDAAMLKVINELSDEQIEVFEAELVAAP